MGWGACPDWAETWGLELPRTTAQGAVFLCWEAAASWRTPASGLCSHPFSCSLGHARERAQVPHPRLHGSGPREQQPEHTQKVLAKLGVARAAWVRRACRGPSGQPSVSLG